MEKYAEQLIAVNNADLRVHTRSYEAWGSKDRSYLATISSKKEGCEWEVERKGKTAAEAFDAAYTMASKLVDLPVIGDD